MSLTTWSCTDLRFVTVSTHSFVSVFHVPGVPVPAGDVVMGVTFMRMTAGLMVIYGFVVHNCVTTHSCPYFTLSDVPVPAGNVFMGVTFLSTTANQLVLYGFTKHHFFPTHLCHYFTILGGPVSASDVGRDHGIDLRVRHGGFSGVVWLHDYGAS